MKPRLDRTLLGVTISLVALIAAACTSGDAPETSASAAASQSAPSEAALPSTAASATAGTDGEETSVFDLEVGDCFSASEDQLETVVVVSCDAAHVFEVYHVFDHEAGDDEEYPGDDAILEYADTECQVPFEDFVGKDYETSVWYITSVTPSQETWDQGDREIVCTLNLEDRSEVTGTAEGSGE